MATKLMSARDAAALIEPGMCVGLGGFSTTRKCMAIIHELLRAGTGDLHLIGTNLSIDMDMLVAKGQVRRVDCGTGNLERYGLAFNFRRAIERGEIVVEDYSHLGMSMRLTAGELGLPFIPLRSWRGSDIERYSTIAKRVTDPFTGREELVVKALQPAIALVHAQRADERGTFQLLGCTFHDIELVRASERTIVVCEELVESDYFRSRPERASVSYPYVAAVVHAPGSAHPTGVYRHYDYDADFIRKYQAAARAGTTETCAFIDERVLAYDSNDAYLDAQADREALRADPERGY